MGAPEAADRKETPMKQPVTELDTRFSDQDAVATDWGPIDG